MSDDIRQGFIRQRRNLILVSLVVVFLEFAGVELKELNILGNKLSIKNPFIVNVSFWIALVYWFARYLQYFNDLPSNNFHSSYIKMMQQYVKNVALKKNLNSVENNDGEKRQLELSELSYNHTGKNKWELGLEFNVTTDSSNFMSSEVFHWTVEGTDLSMCKIKAFLHVFFLTRNFTEYFLPFLLSGVVTLFVLFKYVGKLL